MHLVECIPDGLQFSQLGPPFVDAAISCRQEFPQFLAGQFSFSRRLISFQDAQKEFSHFPSDGTHAVLPDGLGAVVAGFEWVGEEDITQDVIQVALRGVHEPADVVQPVGVVAIVVKLGQEVFAVVGVASSLAKLVFVGDHSREVTEEAR